MSRTPTGRRQPRHGAIMAQAALTVTALIGILAIGLDGGLLLVERRHAQETADAAALGAAASLYQNVGTDSGLDPNGTAASRALAVAALNGYSNDGTYSLITPNLKDGSGNPVHGVFVPPASGNFAGQAGHVEVVVQYNQPRGFSAIWGGATIPVSARAVARGNMGAGTSILTLGSTGTSLTIGGNSLITVPGTVIVDSSSSNASTIGGSAGLVSPEIDLVGGISGTSSNPNNNLKTGGSVVHTISPAVPDPLSGIAAPDPASLTARTLPSIPASGTVNLQAGYYNSGLTTGGSVNVTLGDSGIYYFNGGITWGSSGTLISGTTVPTAGTLATTNRTNVMIYINPGASANGFDVQQGIVQLLPPTSGTYQGISIFENRTSSKAINISAAHAYTDIEGTIYAAGASMTLSGSSNIIVGSSFIANTITLSGSSNFTIPPPKIPTPGLAKRDIRLEE